MPLVWRGLRLTGPVAVPMLLGTLLALRDAGAASQPVYLALLVGASIVLRPAPLAMLWLCTVMAMLSPMAYVGRPAAVLAPCLVTLFTAGVGSMVVRPVRLLARERDRGRLAQTSEFAVRHGSVSGTTHRGRLAEAAVRQLERR